MLRQELHGKTVLLLQGPVGPYFRRLAAELDAAGARVLKVNFNGGDVFFFPGGARYRGHMEDIPAYVSNLIEREHIDILMLCGDCRPVHAGMADLARRHGIELKVFEEGYLRPDFVTCESMGVNGYSTIPRDPRAYDDEPPNTGADTYPVGNTYWWMVLWTTLYYAACYVTSGFFSRYVHHRTLSILEAGRWLRGVGRKWLCRWREQGIQEDLCTNWSRRFYIVPLQVHNDAQIRVHSPYESVEHFIDEVIDSFARHAPSGTLLVFKHHPMDRAYRDFARQIRTRATEQGVRSRVRYIHDQHLPTLFTHASGAVVVNSTAGLAAIHQRVPTKVMGNAVFDIAGLTWQRSIDLFWCAGKSAAIDYDLYLRFRSYLIRTSQLNDSFYRLTIPRVGRARKSTAVDNVDNLARPPTSLVSERSKAGNELDPVRRTDLRSSIDA